MILLTSFSVAFLLAAQAVSQDVEPAKCCVDRQFTAQMASVGGRTYPITGSTVFWDTYSTVAYDYYNKRVGAEIHVRQPNGSEEVMGVLYDFNRKMQYGEKHDGSCFTAPLNDPMGEAWVSQNAKYLGEGKFGYGTESLAIQTWEYIIPGTDINTKRAFTKSCVPVVSTYYGTIDNMPQNAVEFFSNYSPGIPDLSVLDVNTYITPANSNRSCDTFNAR